ncbi:MAG TPA: mechanosensitive ion channel family protein [Lentisphaeria bacterium]|nr:mechanosensitive ion channel family protein [Lentisphaeria bacterium]
MGNELFSKVSDFIAAHQDGLITSGKRLLMALLIIAITVVVTRIVRRVVTTMLNRIKGWDDTATPIITEMLGYLLYTIGALVLLEVFGFNTNSLIALLGAAGIAVGLALKDTLSNLAAGLMLLFLRPFKAGDFIECGSVSGVVKEIDMFTTILGTPDGLYISAPNSALWGPPIKNYTRNGSRRLDITVGISYNDSIETGLAVLLGLAANEPTILRDPAPQAILLKMNDSSIDLQLRVWLPIGEYWNTYWKLNRQVKEGIEAAGLTIPFPQQTLSFTKDASAMIEAFKKS